MSVSEPSKILTPWGTSGLKNAIPSAADPVTGKAGYDQGFPAINMTAKEAGGIPPFGQDFNGIFFDITQILQYMQAGGHPTYSSSLATSIGGYPLGAMLAKTNGMGFWRNNIANNTTNPDSGGAGWLSDVIGGYASASIITSTSTTLTPSQVGQALLFTTASSTVSLPLPSAVISGGRFKLVTSAGLTISISGGGSFQAGNASVTSLLIPAGSEVDAICTGSGWWVIGTGALANAASFSFGGAAGGPQRLPSGLIIQWGSFNITSVTAGVLATTTVTLGTANPNALLKVLICPNNSDGSAVSYSVNASKPNPNQFIGQMILQATGTRTLEYVAIGY